MIRHIVAIDRQRGMAKNGSIPWSLSTDKQFYRSEIRKYGGVLLMGRKTFESAGESISDHQCYVMTRNKAFQTDKAIVIHDVEEILNLHQDVWVIGGSAVYGLTLSRADELYITQIDADFDCDTFYPEFSEDFELTRRGEDITENNLSFRFNVYTPKKR